MMEYSESLGESKRFPDSKTTEVESVSNMSEQAVGTNNPKQIHAPQTVFMFFIFIFITDIFTL
ncbi:hypothetical protein HMPREF9441_00903 [Paraprevotella clara YIT 11840]|uniref:Uncharacterized protein n=1 Tax=Paraprevotella clara YIT 11840 TaxID=762968 RepID=G5SNH3_9BACT|nr:hypothetical protein HMPREF9441_00903 [Paraprevotella clara YIT 11840]MBD9175194.1 hypothetical protein [Paraprevotella clara]RGU65070.1 hypothetical protein DWW55_03105 [Paraprevotella clara]